MGLAASQARLLALTARKSDLEFVLQQINQARMKLAGQVMGISGILARIANNGITNPNNPGNRDPRTGTPEGAANADLLRIQQQDKILELQANQIDTQHKAVSTEIEVVRKVIQKNIQMSFKLLS